MKTRLLALMLVLCMAVGAIAGCSNDTQKDPTPTQGSQDPAPTQGGVSISSATPVDTSGDPEPQYGGDLVLVLGMRPSFFLPKVSGKGTQMLICPAIESLGRQQPDGSWEPFLAESWEGDPENLTFTIKLREGIMFHDGSELTAEVVTWNFDIMMEAGRRVDLCSPSSYEATDEYTVVMHFDAWNSMIYEILGMVRIVSKYSYDTYGEDYMQVNAVGTGAFIQDEYVQGNSIKFVRNENYWQEGLPYLDSITQINMTDENTKISSLLNGEVHACSFNKESSIVQLQSVDGLKNILNQCAGTASTMQIMVNSVNNPFEDVLVRQAVMYALDRDASAKALVYGATGICQMGVPGSYTYLENPTYTYDYDPEKAKELLTEAGYPNGFETELLNTQLSEAQMVALKSYLDAVGINCTINLVDKATEDEHWLQGTFKGLSCSGGSPASVDWCNFIDRTCGPNRTRYVPSQQDFPEFYDLILKEAVATTEEEQKSLAQEVGKYINENLPMLPWYASYSYYFTADNLYGTRYYDIQSWQWTPETAYFA